MRRCRLKCPSCRSRRRQHARCLSLASRLSVLCGRPARAPLAAMGHASSAVSPSRPDVVAVVGACPPILRLAQVEQQLIMHCLQATEIIRLARSSKQLLYSAQSVFAFKHASFRLQPTARTVLPHSDASLLGFSSLHITLLSDSHVASLQSTVTVMPLRVLDLTSVRRWPVASWAHLCAIPFPHLTSLAFHAWPDLIGGSASAFRVSLERLLAHAPKLSSLDVRTNPEPMTAHNHQDTWLIIAQLPIPRISLTDTHANRSRSHLPFMATLPSLQHLVVRSPSLYGSDFRRVLTTLPQLVSLELHFFHCAGRECVGTVAVLPRDYLAAFQSLRSLQRMRLFSCYQPHALIPHVAHAPSLRLLEVEGDWMASTAPLEMPLLSAAVADLLSATRGLHCTLLFRCSSPEQVRLDPLLRLCDTDHSDRLSTFQDRFDLVVTGRTQTPPL